MQQLYKIIDITEKEKWDEALVNVPHSFTHTAECCRALHLNSGLRTFLFLFEKEGVKICCPLIERELNGITDIAKPFGISGFTGNGVHPDFYEAWLGFVKKRGYLTGYSLLHPLYGKKPWFPSESIYPHNSVKVLDLTPDNDVLLANMSRKRRQQLSNCESVRENVTTNRSDILSFFLEHYHDFLDRKNAASYYYHSEESMEHFFRADNCVAVGVAERGKLVSAAYFGYSTYLADSLFMLSLPGKNYYSAELTWFAILELKNKGIPVLNMGGGAGGIAEFKRRFGAHDEPVYSLKEVFDKDAYKQINGKAAIDLNDKSGFFPGYRKPYYEKTGV